MAHHLFITPDIVILPPASCRSVTTLSINFNIQFYRGQYTEIKKKFCNRILWNCLDSGIYQRLMKLLFSGESYGPSVFLSALWVVTGVSGTMQCTQSAPGV